MNPIYCVMFSRPMSDDVRDVLFANAYLMLKSYSKKKKIRTKCCEGVITTNFKNIALYGMNGILFEGKLETDQGDLKVSYLVRHQDLQAIEESKYASWLGLEDLCKPSSPSNMRPNPIHTVSKKHAEN